MKQIFGDFSSPSVYPRSYVEKEAKILGNWQHDDLPSYIPALNTMLKTKSTFGSSTTNLQRQHWFTNGNLFPL